MEKRLTYPERILRQDIKYRGPLSFRGLRIVAWVAMAFSICIIALNWGISFLGLVGREEAASNYETIAQVFSYFATLPLPLFLLANFGLIAKGRGEYKKLIIRFSIFAIVIILAFYLFLVRYIYVFSYKFASDETPASELIDNFNNILVSHHGSFNVFIDLLLCTLLSFFLEYKPKTRFQGKKLIYFRLMILIPILYEIGMVILRELNTYVFTLPIFFLPFFPTKPPLMILLFFGIVFFMKIMRKRAYKKGMSKADYHTYLKSNGHSLMFSISVSVGLLIVSTIDFILLMILVYVDLSLPALYLLKILGTGDTFAVFFAIPIVMLYSYTKKPKDIPSIDILIPIGGIALCAIALIEGIFSFIFAAS